MSDSNKYANVDYRLKNLTNALYVTNTNDVAIRTGIEGNIIIAGDVNIPAELLVYSNVSNPLHTHITEIGTTNLLAQNLSYMPIGGNVGITGNIAGITKLPPVSITGNIAGITSLPPIAIASIPEVEIKNDTGNAIPVSATTSPNSNSNPIFVKGTSDTSFFAPTQSDAFGRLRVSNPFTLNDHFNRYQDNGFSSNVNAGSGTIGFDANIAAITMNVGTASGDSVVRESNRVYAYQPGKSLLVMQTFTMSPAKANLTQRVGYFDSTNGYYLEQVGTNINFVERSSSSGILLETRKAQTDWNVNKLPGLDLSKSQILFMDIEWLGVGTVRMGFVIDGQFVLCHQWHHANIITGTYITTACLPVRKEIFNTGTTGSSSTMLSICNSVISEGGYNITGRPMCIGHSLGTPVSLSNTPTTFTPLISIRLKSTRLGAIVLPTTFTVTPVQQAVFKYQIYIRAITSGGTWISAGADSSVEYNLNPTSITAGVVALSAFINASNQSASSVENAELPFQYQLERNSFVPTCYEIVIAAAASTNSCTAYANLNWTEIT